MSIIAKSTRRPIVLVVDDFADNREMYSEYLSFAGYDVIEARNGLEAIDAAQQRLPDIIIMDLSLPVMDGWEATRRLKRSEEHTSELQSRLHLVCRLLLEKKKQNKKRRHTK